MATKKEAGEMMLGQRPESDLVDIEVTADQVENLRRHLKGCLRSAILDANYNMDPGRVSNLMSDLRALRFVNPTKEDARPAPAKPMTEQQRAVVDDAAMQGYQAKRERALSAERV
jgi:hypothetical protein